MNKGLGNEQVEYESKDRIYGLWVTKTGRSTSEGVIEQEFTCVGRQTTKYSVDIIVLIAKSRLSLYKNT